MRMLRSFVGTLGLCALCSGGTAAAQEAVDTEEELAPQDDAEDDVDVTGTWSVSMNTTAQIAAPLIGASATNVQLRMKLRVTEEAGGLRADYQICRLSTDSSTLKVDYTPFLPFLTTSSAVPAFEARVGGSLPLPDLTFRVGQSASGAGVDQDNDRHPGATLPVTALGLLKMDAYMGMTMNVKLSAVLKDLDTVEGTATFGATGKVFGSSSPLLPSGEIRVTATEANPKFTAKRVAGDPTCAQLLSTR